MKVLNQKSVLLVLTLSVIILTTSCRKKKLTEVVEVPLPTTEQKMTIGDPEDVKAAEGAFNVVKLPFKYDAFAPTIDAMTMEIHYSRHYLTYTNNLNKALAGTDLATLPIEELHKKLDMSNAELRNNLGGYYNHSLYFKCIGAKAAGQPKDSLAAAIYKDFESFDNFSTQFKGEATKLFGSGWVWLIVDRSGSLQITSTQNQDNPLMRNALIPGKPILALDLWEHAYYLDYQYKRKNYVDAFFNVINWKKVGENYEEALKK